MREMTRSRREIEVKLAFESPQRARAAIETLGATLVRERHFEDNVVFDAEGEPLKSSGRLLRLRRAGSRALLTYKAPVGGTHRHKVRAEEELTVGDPEVLERILVGLGFHPCYRYQKYRTLFAVDELLVCLDETPIGCFVELEGSPEGIDRAAQRMGVDPADCIVETYRGLQERYARERAIEAGDMVFEAGGERDDG